MSADRRLIRAGFLLILLALLTGLAIPAFLNHKAALATHVSAVLNGLLLVAVGLAWGVIGVREKRAGLVRGLFIAGTYMNWASGVIASSLGTSRLTPMAGAGFHASPAVEAINATIQVALGLIDLTALAIVVFEMRPRREAAPAAKTATA